jgi:hypothetical protein
MKILVEVPAPKGSKINSVSVGVHPPIARNSGGSIYYFATILQVDGQPFLANTKMELLAKLDNEEVFTNLTTFKADRAFLRAIIERLP